MKINEIIKESTGGLDLKVSKNSEGVAIKATSGGKQLGHAEFFFDDEGNLDPQSVWVNERFHRQGIAKTMYDHLKSLGYTIIRSWDQTDAGKGFWDKHRGEDVTVWEDDLSEAPLADYVPMGDFNKPGPFRSKVDKKLITHPVNQLKTAKFLENTPYDFRLFFSNIPGTANRKEIGPVDHAYVESVFGEQAQQIINGSEDAITVVFLGNSGADKVMMTPWIMAHRLGHAIQAGARSQRVWTQWGEAERHFFGSINQTLTDVYRKDTRARDINYDKAAEYNAIFNAIGTQRSSRENQIKRPYEFLYEIFAQYIKDGKVTLNPFPKSLGYGRQAWGNPTKYMGAHQMTDEELADMAETLSNDMGYMFSDVLSECVGKIFLM